MVVGSTTKTARESDLAPGRDVGLLAEGASCFERGGEVPVARDEHRDVVSVDRGEANEVGDEGRVDLLLLGVPHCLFAVLAGEGADPAREALDEVARLLFEPVEEAGEALLAGRVCFGAALDACVVVGGPEAGATGFSDEPVGEPHEVEGLTVRLVTPGAVEVLAVEEKGGTHCSLE